MNKTLRSLANHDGSIQSFIVANLPPHISRAYKLIQHNPSCDSTYVAREMDLPMAQTGNILLELLAYKVIEREKIQKIWRYRVR